MAAAWPRPMVVLLLALLAAAAGLLHPVDTQALQCHGVREVGKDNRGVFPLDEQATKSIRFSFPVGKTWKATFDLGEGSAENYQSRFLLNIAKTSNAQLARLKVTTSGSGTKFLLNTRVDSSWLEGEGQATLFFGESALNIAFINGDSKFLMQLSVPELAGLSAVQVHELGQVEECEGPGSVPDTVAMTTAKTTTTTTTTTEPTTTTTTTTEPTTTTTEPTTTTPVAETSTTTPVSAESSPLTTEATYNATTSEDGLTPACVPTGNNVTVACPTPSNDSVPAVGVTQCEAVPRWAWACAGLAVVFFVFIVGLIIYSITLYKRSFRLGKGMQASGGFGMTAQDMHYYEMRNNNLSIGNTVPRIVTPRPSSTPGITPSHSTSRLSHSLSPSRSTTPFPFLHQNTDLDDSKNTATEPKDKSRSSKVSFAED